MAPKIGIPIPTSFDAAYNRLNYPAYFDAVRSSGGEPIELPFSLDSKGLRDVIAGLSGILLPGSPADVEPELYAQVRIPETAPADPAREQLDRTLLEEAYRLKMPIFGICFGMQFLNVFCGGTLVQDLITMPLNHSAGRAVAIAHPIVVPSASLLAEMLDPAEATRSEDTLRLPINSSHHQAVGIAGSGLVVSARSPEDGVVEAVEGAGSAAGGHFILGVQWHPERSMELSGSSRSIFSRFIAEAANWQR